MIVRRDTAGHAKATPAYRLLLIAYRLSLFHPFFLHPGPSLASCFSVMWPVPAALISAALSLLIWIQFCHWAGTLASAKIASTGHSGTHASQSMQSTSSI